MSTDLRGAVRDRSGPAAPTPGDGDRGEGGRGPLDRALDIGVPALLVLLAGVLRFWRLGYPERIYFDETYYANDANQYLARGVEEGFAVHPPVGKWLIAAGIEVAGFDGFGWRSAAAVAGTLLVGVTYLAALRLFRNRGVAALAALLVTVDGLAFTMSRIAMLDIFLALFVMVGFVLLLVDRDRMWALVPLAPPPPGQRGELPRADHRYRWLAGLAFGLALSTKWSAALAIAAAGLFVLASELLWRRRTTGRALTRSWEIVASGCGTLLLVPVIVYFASHAGWFANYESTRLGLAECPDGVCVDVGPGDVVTAWWGEQDAIAGFHRGLTAEHPYRAPATTWFLMNRPVAYYFESCDDPANPPEGGCVVAQGNVEEILGVGNPAIWWMALPAYLVVAGYAVLRRDWRAAAVLGFVLAQFLPWVVTSLPWLATTRPVFLFYMAPVVPFMCLVLAYVAWRALGHAGTRHVVPPLIAVAAVGAFLFLYPVLVGLELPRSAWDLRILMPSWI